MGKPSVRFRKVVNTVTDDGQMVAVTAQQYAVLVMDVPDLEAAYRKYVCLLHTLNYVFQCLNIVRDEKCLLLSIC